MTHPIHPPVKRAGWRLIAAVMTASLGLMAGAPARANEASPAPPQSAAARVGPHADFGGATASSDAHRIADWIILTGDNRGLPFIIVDKKATKVFVFDGRASLRGATTALLGLARGDDSAPGVGDRKLADIAPGDRTTPAGRFVASLGLNLAKQDILWVDYKTALALHRVLGANTSQHRLERLAANSALDRRITFGCINVPVSFYEEVVRPQFVGSTGVVYILPETKSLQEVFFRAPSADRAL